MFLQGAPDVSKSTVDELTKSAVERLQTEGRKEKHKCKQAHGCALAQSCMASIDDGLSQIHQS